MYTVRSLHVSFAEFSMFTQTNIDERDQSELKIIVLNDEQYIILVNSSWF